MALGDIIRSWSTPGGSGFGLTWDGRALWHTDGSPDLVYQLDPRDGTVIRSFATPGAVGSGLAWDGRALWLVDSAADLIYQLSKTL